MTDLGERVGVSRQAISLYEDGQRTPDPEVLGRILKELDQPIAYFTTDRPRSFGARGPRFFRAFKSKTKRTNTKCEILSDWLVQITSYFSDYVNLPAVTLPEIPSPEKRGMYTDAEIEDAAILCRQHWGLGDGPIANVVALFESKGIVVARSEVGSDSVSAFSFWEGSRPFIFLGADRESACRSRFDAAHELGHILLHRGVDVDDIENDLDRIEAEADRFAGAFLLPESSYPLEVFSSRLAAFIHLKKRWKVSAAAQIHRCADLGIVDEQQVLNLRKQLSANRWRKREPLDDKIVIEVPSVLEKSTKLLLDSKARTVYDLLSGIRLGQRTIESYIGMLLPAIGDSGSTSPAVSLRDK